MRFAIIYRLTHPEYVSVTTTTIVTASTHSELERQLAKVRDTWEVQGYTMRVLRIRGKQDHLK